MISPRCRLCRAGNPTSGNGVTVASGWCQYQFHGQRSCCMIHGYSDHAANERTFLAWVRTGIAVIALGFVVEKFDLFIRTLASAKLSDAAVLSRLQSLSGPLGHYDGIALIVFGIALVILAAVRFIRLDRMIADEAMHSMDSVRFELIVSAALLLIVAGTVSYLALG